MVQQKKNQIWLLEQIEAPKRIAVYIIFVEVQLEMKVNMQVFDLVLVAC
jgi:hypothetical protein